MSTMTAPFSLWELGSDDGGSEDEGPSLDIFFDTGDSQYESALVASGGWMFEAPPTTVTLTDITVEDTNGISLDLLAGDAVFDDSWATAFASTTVTTDSPASQTSHRSTTRPPVYPSYAAAVANGGNLPSPTPPSPQTPATTPKQTPSGPSHRSKPGSRSGAPKASRKPSVKQINKSGGTSKRGRAGVTAASAAAVQAVAAVQAAAASGSLSSVTPVSPVKRTSSHSPSMGSSRSSSTIGTIGSAAPVGNDPGEDAYVDILGDSDDENTSPARPAPATTSHLLHPHQHLPHAPIQQQHQQPQQLHGAYPHTPHTTPVANVRAPPSTPNPMAGGVRGATFGNPNLFGSSSPAMPPPLPSLRPGAMDMPLAGFHGTSLPALGDEGLAAVHASLTRLEEAQRNGLPSAFPFAAAAVAGEEPSWMTSSGATSPVGRPNSPDPFAAATSVGLHQAVSAPVSPAIELRSLGMAMPAPSLPANSLAEALAGLSGSGSSIAGPPAALTPARPGSAPVTSTFSPPCTPLLGLSLHSRPSSPTKVTPSSLTSAPPSQSRPTRPTPSSGGQIASQTKKRKQQASAAAANAIAAATNKIATSGGAYGSRKNSKKRFAKKELRAVFEVEQVMSISRNVDDEDEDVDIDDI